MYCVSEGSEPYTCHRAYRDGVIYKLSLIAPHPTNVFRYDLSGIRHAEAKGIRIVRVFVELYLDGFGIWRKIKHSPDGIYITIGNQRRCVRIKLDNIHCLGIKSPNTSTNEALRPIIDDLKK